MTTLTEQPRVLGRHGRYNEVLNAVSRQERRQLLAAEAKARTRGEWGEWERIPLPNGVPGARGWAREVRHSGLRLNGKGAAEHPP